jgi:hypothetical protein
VDAEEGAGELKGYTGDAWVRGVSSIGDTASLHEHPVPRIQRAPAYPVNRAEGLGLP